MVHMQLQAVITDKLPVFTDTQTNSLLQADAFEWNIYVIESTHKIPHKQKIREITS